MLEKLKEKIASWSGVAEELVDDLQAQKEDPKVIYSIHNSYPKINEKGEIIDLDRDPKEDADRQKSIQTYLWSKVAINLIKITGSVIVKVTAVINLTKIIAALILHYWGITI